MWQILVGNSEKQKLFGVLNFFQNGKTKLFEKLDVYIETLEN